MNILIYSWGENSIDDISQTFIQLGHTCTKFTHPINNIDFDEDFIKFLCQMTSSVSFDVIFTFNYFPVVSYAAQIMNIPYISWVYDNPHYSLFSPSVRNSCNHIFLFDESEYEMLKKKDIKNVHHLSLAVNTARIYNQLKAHESNTKTHYDVSFVGSLYEHTMFDQISYLPQYLKGYINAIIDLQIQTRTCDFISDALTDEIIDALNKYIKLDLPKDYELSPQLFYKNMILSKITGIERKEILALTSRQFDTHIFTGSDTSELPDINAHGFISYVDTMPYVFHDSKINLNITLRTISSGIPLRAIDIMGCGGFLLTNCQPELEKNFVDGKELVFYENYNDLLNKIKYYLSHEEERIQIAQNGYHRVCKDFTYIKQVTAMLKTL